MLQVIYGSRDVVNYLSPIFKVTGAQRRIVKFFKIWVKLDIKEKIKVHWNKNLTSCILYMNYYWGKKKSSMGTSKKFVPLDFILALFCENLE